MSFYSVAVLLQLGQLLLYLSHGVIHVLWKKWEHLSLVNSSPTLNSVMQIEQVTALHTPFLNL